MSLDSADSRPSKFQCLTLTDALIRVTARQLGVQAPIRPSQWHLLLPAQVDSRGLSLQ